MDIWKLLLRLQELSWTTIRTLLSFPKVDLWIVHRSQSVILGRRKAIAICLCDAHILISFA